MSVTTAVVLAAGEGVRLRPLTRNRPKPMLPAATRPILEHVLDALVDAGMEQLVLVVGYRRNRVQEHFGHEYRDVPIEYVIQEKQLGSGHALLQAKDIVSGSVLVVNGDHLVEACAVGDVVEVHESGETAATIAVIEREDPRTYGAVTVENGAITALVEKPECGDFRLINAGIYAFGPDIFEYIEDTDRESGELALTDTISRLVERERVGAVHVEGIWVDATYPWDLLDVTEAVLAAGAVSEPAVEEHAEQHVYVADGARVHETATLCPPVAIATEAEIGPGAVVGPSVAVGRNATVGANVTIERSVLDADVRVGPGVTLVDVVCGENVALGAGTVVSGGPADVRVGQRVFTERRLGAVFADRVCVGGAVSVDPGTLVGPGATVETGASLRGSIPGDGRVMR